jgi:hypothetical protein
MSKIIMNWNEVSFWNLVSAVEEIWEAHEEDAIEIAGHRPKKSKN